MLKREIETRSTVETKSKILEEMRLIRAHLESDEEESLRLRVSRPLTHVSRKPTISSSLTPGESPVGEVNTSRKLCHESPLTRSMTKNSTTYSLRSVRKFSSSYHSAGLSDDCSHALFYNDSEVSVYRLGDIRTKDTSPSFSRIFNQQYKHGEFIRNVAPSRAFIVIVTNKRLLVFKFDADTLIGTVSHGDWDPSGLACHESKTHLVVFLGQCQRNKTKKYDGQIRVSRYRIDGQATNMPVFALNMPANDCPKRITFDTESQILTCITRIQNKLSIWKLDNEFFSSVEPFEFLKNKYTAVSAQNPSSPADRC